MKVFISVDMEGCSGIVSRHETMPTGDFYREARHWMAWDANAAVDGCLDRGATQVVICESHNGLGIPWDELHPKAKLVRKEQAHKRIHDAAKTAVEKASTLKPFTFASPTQLEVDLLSPTSAAKLTLLPGVQRTAELTVCYNSEGFDNVWRTLWAMVFIASTTRDPIPW